MLQVLKLLIDLSVIQALGPDVRTSKNHTSGSDKRASGIGRHNKNWKLPNNVGVF